jgi:hypothetical protein
MILTWVGTHVEGTNSPLMSNSFNSLLICLLLLPIFESEPILVGSKTIFIAVANVRVE